ncbi:hypothetical protein FA13DRAFT_1804109 [Coprinellus micaceus]|uniref:C3H1-type domain-containing protein n=1 Tax=Coprinellus micaceus TaxID=71717 RepID=A0A4Y7SA87_COPMI|nr:hypothetical protein FA13DRAFT_1804109 [Coprinellus micaceus]
MSLREPAWRAPSRPCPFYQRGNCIFAAKCNFLHTIPQRRYSVEQSVKSLHKVKESLDYDAPPPILRVDSPASIRSPPHEPQMQRLLSALTDVIGDEEGDELEDEETLTEPDEPDSWSAGLPTLVHGADATFFARVNDTMAELMQLTDAEGDDDDDDILSSSHRDDNDNTLEAFEDSAKEYPNTPQFIPPKAHQKPNTLKCRLQSFPKVTTISYPRSTSPHHYS